MINYELAKKLKDAGFPSPKDYEGKYFFCECISCGVKTPREQNKHLIHHDNDEGCLVGNDYGHRFSPKDIKLVHAPTLPELIEACGDKFSWLKRLEFFNVTWEAACNSMPGIKCYEPTPEEAVSMLWLKINNK